ncbi:MAG: hypothetical protein HRU75_10230 [Planctomycetia bacterium]|nr:MAG: hypothetical protein HRU75_10230 [Planctomycetia bacterium]
MSRFVLIAVALVASGFSASVARAGDLDLDLSIGWDRGRHYEPVYYGSSCYTPAPRYVRHYYYDDCAPVVVRPYPRPNYRDCGPTYGRSVRTYSTRSYYAPRYHERRGVSVHIGGRDRGRSCYR